MEETKNKNQQLADFSKDLSAWLSNFHESIEDTPKAQSLLYRSQIILKDHDSTFPNVDLIAGLLHQMLELTFVINDNRVAFGEFMRLNLNTEIYLVK